MTSTQPQLANEGIAKLAELLGGVTIQLPDGSTSDLAKEITLAAASKPAAPASEPDKYTVYGENIELPASITKPLLKAYKDAKAEYEKAKQAFDAAKDEIGEAMNYHEVLVVEETGQIVAEYRVVDAQVLDTTKLKKDLPEVAAKYQRTRHSRSVRVLV